MSQTNVILRPYRKTIDRQINLRMFDHGSNSFISLEKKKNTLGN